MNMTNLLHNIRKVCRICLTECDNMVSLNNKLDSKFENSPIILDVLQNIFSIQVVNNKEYPEQVCIMCFGQIKLSYDLKLIYIKSQRIIEKYVCLRNLSDVEVIKTECNSSTMELHSEELLDCKEECISDTSYSCDLSSNDSLDSIIDNIDENLDVLDNSNDFKNKGDNNKGKLSTKTKFYIETESTPKQLVRCHCCFKHFMSNDLLTEHQKTCKNTSPSSLKDSLIKKIQNKKDNTKHTQKVPECKLCNRLFKNNKALSYHNSTQHNAKGQRYVCKICAKGFYVKSSLSQHMDVHSKGVSKVVCPICGKGFHYRGGLHYHLKIHRNERNYTCNYCDRKFLNVSGLKKHIRIHTGERPFTCAYCGKAFLSKNILDNHEKTHTGIKTHFCSYCAKGFITSYSLKVHISSHSGSIPCQFCNRSFLNEEVLKLHMKFKHIISNQGIKDDE